MMRPTSAVLLLAAATVACLVPFLGKAFHIDDPLFVWTAQHIQSHPLNFYGFNIDWGLAPAPMYEQMQNPPLAAYYLAVAGAVLGWSEVALHSAFLLPAVAFIIGTYFLARRWCAHPFAAAVAALAAPVFLLCGSSLMCDTMMMAMWVWAVFFWREGLERKCPARLAAAAMLIAACSLTKYFGVCLIPLLLVYSALKEGRVGSWLLFLCVPVVALAGYQCLTHRLYGYGLLTAAATYATQRRIEGGFGTKLLETLSYGGGCLMVPLAAIPLLWGRRGVAASLTGVVAIGWLVFAMHKVGVSVIVRPGRVNWLLVGQMALFVCGGVAPLVLATADLVRNRNADSVLLFLWVTGTCVFVGLMNWTVSGRNILPMLPAVSLLLIRRLESRAEGLRHFWWPLGVSVAAALLVAEGDWKFAESARQAALLINKEAGGRPEPIEFEGHWGFQYYMEALGAKPLILQPMRLTPKEVIVMPMNNTCWVDLPAGRVAPLAEIKVPTAGWVSLMNPATGAGYYSDDWGPAPFVFGPSGPEEYDLFRVK
jgi:hypothetical protein